MSDSVQSLTMPWGIKEIERALPHRYPFLLIDRVLELVPRESVLAIKNISVSEPVLQGHFPGSPIYPGVMTVEGLAQAAGILSYVSPEKGISSMLLTEVQNARFRRQIIPGDTITYSVRLIKSRGKFFWFSGEARVGNEVAVECELSALVN
ncbi:MAG: 3-hydroxyacyl-ACP dehydratase FabZ [Pseudomonadota bacterium]